MSETRASAAWAGIAMATSLLSVTIVGTQPHTTTATSAIAESVAMTSLPVDALDSDKSLKRVDTTDRSKARAD
jgi:hypothetical protein